MTPFRLKTKRRSDGYPASRCAASRCLERSVVVVATRRDWPDDVPLCDRHWEAYCAEDDIVVFGTPAVPEDHDPQLELVSLSLDPWRIERRNRGR